MLKSIVDVTNERWRQIDDEGLSWEHDDEHTVGELALAASCYAVSGSGRGIGFIADHNWPWDDKWWKPKSPREDLVRAGALILAEIERLDRAEHEKEQTA